MDTSDKYIKMCREGEEIQNEWGPCCGDWYIQYDDPCSDPNDPAHGVYGEEKLYRIGTDDDQNLRYFYNQRADFTWLPRQDQLQEMFKDVFTDPQSYKLNLELSRYIQQELGCPPPFDSLEQLWLAFAMHKKYQKFWDETNEEWVKR